MLHVQGLLSCSVLSISKDTGNNQGRSVMAFGVLWVILLLLQLTAAKETNPSRPPNFVIMIADDAGIGDFGCYGNTTLKTPNVDRIAREGALLTHHLASASVCAPSRAALLTGRYQSRSGMASNNPVRVNPILANLNGLPSNETTLAELVKQKDYATAFIGKWHLGLHESNSKDFAKHPMKQGFDYYYGAPLTNLKDFGDEGLNTIASVVPTWRLVNMAIMLGGVIVALFLYRNAVNKILIFLLLVLILVPGLYIHIYLNYGKLLNSILMREYEVVEHPIDLHDDMTQKLVKEGIQYLEQQKSQERPFFLMMSWLQVHTALHTSEEFKGHSGHSEYGDNIEEMDWSVGEILNALDRLGLAENTFVYFSSDQGGHTQEVDGKGNVVGGYNGIYRGGKTQGGWEGGIRVPAVVRHPGVIKPGSVIDAPTSQMDVFASMADLAGAPLPDDRVIDGRTMVPLLSGKTKSSPHDFLVHLCGASIHAARYIPKSGSDVWKVHFATPRWIPNQDHCGFVCQCLDGDVWYHNPPLLFNIAKDPSERNPLDASDQEYQPIIKLIKDRVQEYKDSITPVPDQFSLLNLLPRPWLQHYCSLPFLYCNK